VSNNLGADAKEKMAFHTWVNGWLFTYAGLSDDWLTVPADLLRNEMSEISEQPQFDAVRLPHATQ
jgi:hypothetical protein